MPSSKPSIATDIVKAVQRELREHADPAKAAPMQSYMKTDMPFYGVQKTERRAIVRRVLREHPIESVCDHRATVKALWNLPHREEKYIAIQIAQQHLQFNRPYDLDIWRRMIVSGAWWDFVDDLAIRLVGDLHLRHRDSVEDRIRGWNDHKDMWLRRSSIIFQIKHKDATDETILFDHCLRRSHESEFFIRKAIGWALREYAKTNPAAVTGFVQKHRKSLSTLSFREASKHLSV